MSGYSGTPLARKLGIQPDSRILLLKPPPEYRAWVAPLPDGVAFTRRAGRTVTIAHLFTSERTHLVRELARLRKALNPDSVVWVSWPKKSSGVLTDITEDEIRSVALPLGFVDVKVCAVSEVWSGLKLVVRKALRG